MKTWLPLRTAGTYAATGLADLGTARPELGQPLLRGAHADRPLEVGDQVLRVHARHDLHELPAVRPKLSRICLVACTSTGAVRYSHFVMPATLAADGYAWPPCTPDDVMTRAAELPDAVLRYAAARRRRWSTYTCRPDAVRGRARWSSTCTAASGGRRTTAPHARPLANALARDGVRGRVAGVPPRRRRGALAGDRRPTSTPRSPRCPGCSTGIGVRDHDDHAGRALGRRAPRALAGQPAAPGRPGRRARAGRRPARGRRSTGMGSGAAVDFLGGTPEQVPEVYDAADPAHPDAHPARVPRSSSCTATATTPCPVESSRGLAGPVRLAGLPRAARRRPLRRDRPAVPGLAGRPRRRPRVRRWAA